MCRLLYLLLFAWFSNYYFVYGSENATFTTDMPVDALVNLTGNNDLWTILLKDCENASLTCVQNNIFKYLKLTLDDTDDLQFTSFLKFTKNKLHYAAPLNEDRTFDLRPNDTDDNNGNEFPIEAMARTLQDNTAKFLMTHDLEVGLPEGILPNSVLKIAPQGFGNSGALVNLEIVSKDLEEARGLDEGGRTFKKIRKFINERIIYAVLALLLVLKLLAFKFLFLLPLIVGAATAKKLLLKILLFVFPFLHHIFKFCAYYPIQAKFHHHKHLISHIHQIAPHHHDHHESYGPPVEHHGPHDTHYTELDDDVSVLPDDGSGFPHGLISHRRDPTYDNEVSSVHRKPGRPLTSSEIERLITKAEKEAIIKGRLEKERLRIREENLKLQEQLNQAIKLQEKLKQQAVYLGKKPPPSKLGYGPGKPPASFGVPPLKGSPFDPGATGGPGIELPAGYIPQHTVPQRPSKPPLPSQAVFDQPYQTIQQNQLEQQYQSSVNNHYDQQFQQSQQQVIASSGPIYKAPVEDVNQQVKKTSVDIQQSVEYDPRIGSFENSKEAGGFKGTGTVAVYDKPIKVGPSKSEASNKKVKLDQETDPFYSPILKKIDDILQGLGFTDEPCKERLICSMYKSPPLFSPHSNLLSVELSRDASELQIPTKTNAAVVRFYKYVQAARDGQDQRDCLRLYPTCGINTEAT